MERQEKRDRYGAFLLYVDDWLSSTSIDLMSAAEERGYLRLLMHAWKAPDCGLPDDDSTLSKLSKLGGGWRGQSGEGVRAQFFARDGRLFNDRLLRERQHQQSVRESRSNAGRTAAASRWNAPRIRDAQQNNANPNPNPKPKEMLIACAVEEPPKQALWTPETNLADRDYLREYISAFHDANQRWPEPEECPIRFVSTTRDDAGLIVRMEDAEWDLGGDAVPKAFHVGHGSRVSPGPH